MKSKWKKLALCIAVPLAVGGLAAWLTKDNMIMFRMLNKPMLSPPMWLFPAAWTVLYILMGLASYRVYASDSPAVTKRRGLAYYALSLAFNFGWPILFFNLDAYLAAFIWLCLMFVFTLLAALKFGKADTAAGVLLLPYLLWTAFAGYLNYSIWLLN